ncbi:MAG: DUF5916 domain-containing protein [bacterium]
MDARTVDTALAIVAARTHMAPVIDGSGDDASWRAAPVMRHFTTFAPRPGEEPKFRTELRILYDDQTLYVLVRAFDPTPAAIERRLARRDTFDPTADQVWIFLDPYHDRRTGYEFAVTAGGVKVDGLIANDTDEDPSWDGVWNAATRVDSLGWTAEFAIPFSLLRFTDHRAPTFGIMVGRWVGRTGERVSIPQYYRSRSGLASQFGDLAGLADIGPATAMEVVPYALMRTRNIPSASLGGAGTHGDRIFTDPAIGGDVRWTPRPEISAGVTLNPDYGDVDADPSVLNLSGVEVYQDERRPFFLEGAGALTMPLSPDGLEQLFYSRRIGRSPSLADAFGAPESPTQTAILGAARMSARLAPGTSLALLSAVTSPADGAVRAGGGRYHIEPRGGYALARLQHDFRGGRSGVGMMMTQSYHATGDSLLATVVPSSAQAAAVSTRHETTDGAFQLLAWGATSAVRGDTGAIARLQLAPVHAFQAPDDGVAFDPAATRLDGNAAYLSAGKVGGGALRYGASYRWIGSGFDVNDLGFLQRAGVQNAAITVGEKLTRPGKLAGLPYRSAEFTLGMSGGWTAAGLPLDRGPTTLHARWELPSLAVLHFMGSAPVGSSYCTISCTRGGPALYATPQRSFTLEGTGDPRRALVPHLQLTRNTGRWTGTSALANAAWRIRSNVLASVSAYAANRHEPTAFYRRFGDAASDTAHYTVARLDQYTRSLTARLDYTLATTLTLQWYAEAYVSRGAYSAVRALADAHASDPARQFQPYGDSAVVANPGGIDFRQLRSNAVLRWEYYPGSSVVVVWSQGRSLADGTPGTIAAWPGPELGRIFALAPANTVVMKLSYRIGR